MVDIMATPGLEQNTSNVFRWEVIQLAKRRNLSADWLVAVMSLETGRTFRADIVNPLSGAVGLIQFIKPHFDPAKKGMLADLATYEQAKAMTQVEQLVLVERYFSRVAPDGLSTLCQHYLAVFSPYWMGKAESTVVAVKDSTEPYVPGSTVTKGKVYEQNRSFDTTHKGFYTVADICGVINQFKSTKRIEVSPEATPKEPGPDSHLSRSEWLSLLALSLLADADKRRFALLPPKTKAVLERFQTVQKIVVDGTPGPITLGRLLK